MIAWRTGWLHILVLAMGAIRSRRMAQVLLCDAKGQLILAMGIAVAIRSRRMAQVLLCDAKDMCSL